MVYHIIEEPEEIVERTPTEELLHCAELIYVFLLVPNYHKAKEAYADLKELAGSLSYDELIAMANGYKHKLTHPAVGWFMKAWCDSHGIKNSVIEFETAGCRATPGETMNYRRNKQTWGNLVSITNDDDAVLRRAQMEGENAIRLSLWLKENNPIRIKQTTRNELKLLMGSKLVSSAMRSKKEDFTKEVGQVEGARIERITGLPIGRIWAAIKNGNNDLVDRLRMIPSSRREQMRKSGMHVGSHYDPQLELLNGGLMAPKPRRTPLRRSELLADHYDTQMWLF